MELVIKLCLLIFFFFSSNHAEDSCTLSIRIGRITPNVNKDKVFLIHYPRGQAPIKYTLTNAHVTIPSSPYFNMASPITMLIHGYAVAGPTDFSETISGLQSKNINNIFEFDYYEYAKNPNIPQAVVDGNKIGEYLGSTLSSLKDSGVPGFHLIGHSMGAHMAGFAGKQFKKLKSLLLDRITGLDAARLCYDTEPLDKRLTNTDAAFVDIIHSDAQIGITRSIGHVDFYPNGGDCMPGVLNLDHFMANAYFNESVTNNNFLSVGCANWLTFKTGACQSNPIIPMGYWTPTTARGNCYLKTADKYSYALGTDGLS